jgi:2-methylcitrate dehydratase PrpD
MTVAESVAAWLAGTAVDRLPGEVVERCEQLFLDVSGLCIAARREPYVAATLAAVDRAGPPSPGATREADRPASTARPVAQRPDPGAAGCTALGHAGGFDAFGAALVNGTAAHGEDFDDTFEGGPVHSGAVIVPAVLAACEREALGGDRLLAGVATGVELLCRLSLVAPMAAHNAGFHPTAVFGAVAAAGAVGAALKMPAGAMASALGIAGSMASGIIEYLAEGTWTKRMHAGWAAQSGVRAALMARGGFAGPRTVFEGTHGLFRAFAPSVKPDFAPLLDGLGTKWVVPSVAFKPYACGTMAQPYVDCARRLAGDGVSAADVRDIECEVAAGTVPRLWEPLASKHRPPTPYAAKFSTPFCMAVGFVDGKAGLAQFTDARIADADVLALASKIRYTIDPANPYPRQFTGHLRATLADGRTREYRQPHMRGGAGAPLSAAELEAKFLDNAAYGGWTADAADRLRRASRTIFKERSLEAMKVFRS